MNMKTHREQRAGALLGLGILLVSAGCATTPPADTPEPAPAAPLAADIAACIDPAADPCQDFYAYACGGWLEKTTLPADKSRYGRFGELSEKNLAVLRSILEAPTESPDRAQTFYHACMDEASVEAAGYTSLTPFFQQIDAVDSPQAALTTTGALHRSSIRPFFSPGAYEDLKNPDLVILYIWQGGLGLPDRDYYLEEDKAETRQAYREHVREVFAMAGIEADVDAVIALERRLAEFSKPRAELRDPEKIYNRVDRDGIGALTPGLDWNGYLNAAGLGEATEISVAVPTFLEGVGKVLTQTPLPVLKGYMKWIVTRSLTAALPEEMVQAHFGFFQKKLRGQKEISPRWKRCVRATDRGLGHDLGKLYVARAFGADSKEAALTMIGDIQTAFRDGLTGLDWMDDITRGRAAEKAELVVNKIGYPDRWYEYAGMGSIEPGKYAANLAHTRAWHWKHRMSRLGGPPDKTEWYMTPPTVNAYYNPSANEMVFPAGIMQAPFFAAEGAAAVNYGGIGMVMGHELTHGFDDSGRKFDGKGRLTTWWEPAVSERFEEAAACVEKQYSGFEVQPEVRVNGKLTLGENIADLGGIKLAWEGYQLYREREAPPTRLAAGDVALTDEQLFFVGFAQVWCTLTTPEVEKVKIKTDSHSPPRFRVNGAVSNLPAFADTFACEPGTPMNPTNQCEVW